MGPLADALVSPRTMELLRREFPDRSAAELEAQLEECLKFLTIVSDTGSAFIPLNKAVDQVWHELVVQTQSYAQLCKELPGGKFINHESLDLSDYAARVGHAAAVQEFLAWIPRYVGRFGDFTEERAQYWRVCDFLRTEVGLSLDQINQLGRAALASQASSA